MGTRQWTAEEKEKAKALYPYFTNRELAEILCCKISRLEALARIHRLRKVENFQHYDLTNKQVGELTVLCRTDAKSKRNYLWECRCSCGQVIRVRANLLRKMKVISCGVDGSHRPPRETKISKEGQKVGRQHHRSGGYGPMGGSFWARVKSHACERGLAFLITPEYAVNLFYQQGEKCALSGLLITFPVRFKQHYSGTASLDRIDNSLPYQEGNVRWVHKDINQMRNKHSDDYFITLCKAVAANAEEKAAKGSPEE